MSPTLALIVALTVASAAVARQPAAPAAREPLGKLR
jgi:hypothetical protein